MSQGRPSVARPDHDSIGPGSRERGTRIVRRVDIPVGDQRQMCGRTDLRDGLPVGDALVELLAGAPVHRDCRHAERLGPASQFRGVDARVIPAETHLHRNRHLHG